MTTFAAPAHASVVDCVSNRADTSGTPGLSLVTSPEGEDRRKWNAVIDLLLTWRSNPELIAYPEIPAVETPRLDSAIGIGRKWMGEERPPPTSVAPSVDGGISFEWRTSDRLVEWSEQEPGRWEATVLLSGSPVGP